MANGVTDLLEPGSSLPVPWRRGQVIPVPVSATTPAATRTPAAEEESPLAYWKRQLSTVAPPAETDQSPLAYWRRRLGGEAGTTPAATAPTPEATPVDVAVPTTPVPTRVPTAADVVTPVQVAPTSPTRLRAPEGEVVTPTPTAPRAGAAQPESLLQEALQAYKAALTPIRAGDVASRWQDAMTQAYGAAPEGGRVSWGGDPFATALYRESQRQEEARRASALQAAGQMINYAAAYDPQMAKMARLEQYRQAGLTPTEIEARERQEARARGVMGLPGGISPTAARAEEARGTLPPEEQLRQDLGPYANRVSTVVGKTNPAAPTTAEDVAGMITKLQDQMKPEDWDRYRGRIIDYIQQVHGYNAMRQLTEPGFLARLRGAPVPFSHGIRALTGQELTAQDRAREEILKTRGIGRVR